MVMYTILTSDKPNWRAIRAYFYPFIPYRKLGLNTNLISPSGGFIVDFAVVRHVFTTWQGAGSEEYGGACPGNRPIIHGDEKFRCPFFI
jgi:hypothetical protein